MRRSMKNPANKVLSAIVTVALVSTCSRRKEPAADDDLDIMKQTLAAHFDETCEGAALAAVKTTLDSRTLSRSCDEWHVHGEWPPGTPHELAKQAVLVICSPPRAYYAVKIATGEVLSLANPGEPGLLNARHEAAAAVTRACTHIFD